MLNPISYILNPSLTLRPIGIIRTPYDDRYRAPRQPGVAVTPTDGEIILHPGQNYEQALSDLDGFERIWVIYWFDRNTGWKPKVLPPRGDRRKRGVFATRSPHRPNPLGLSLLRLLSVSGRSIRVADVDLLDGTPIFDIKPYLPYAEAYPDAGIGWLDKIQSQGGSEYHLQWSTLAQEQVEWLQSQYKISLADIAEQVLIHDPYPHPYRRVTTCTEGGFELAIKSWRLQFRVEELTVIVDRVVSGYAIEQLQDQSAELHDQAAQLEFLERYGGIEN